jgi:hypothetical protein
VLAMNTGAPQLNYLTAQRLEDVKMKFLRAIITQAGLRIEAGLQAVGADDAAAGQMLDQQMVACRIEWIGIETRRIGGREAFVQFEVENFETQSLRGADFIRIPRQPGGVMCPRAYQ